MPKTLSKRSTFWCSAFLSTGALLVLFLAGPNAMAADVSSLFQQARVTAGQLDRDAAMLESYTKSNIVWKTHSAKITEIKEHINKAGSILSELHTAREGAQPWQQDGIDAITPTLKELASNTEAAINHLNENPKRLTNPDYLQYVRSNAELAHELATALNNIVEFENTKTKMQQLETNLGKS